MFTKDLAERVVATFAQSFLAIYVVGTTATLKTASIAGATAVLSLMKGVVASKFGDGSPSAAS